MWKTSTKQNFCSQIYYNIIFYYNSQNTQIQVLENRKQKIDTKHTLGSLIEFKHMVVLTNETQTMLSFSRIFKFNIFEFN
jgi:DNA polymerase elongation subunit (family B)